MCDVDIVDCSKGGTIIKFDNVLQVCIINYIIYVHNNDVLCLGGVDNTLWIILGVSLGLAAILIIAAVVAVRRNRRPPQVRQQPNVPVANAKREKEKTTAKGSKSKAHNETAMVPIGRVHNDNVMASTSKAPDNIAVGI